MKIKKLSIALAVAAMAVTAFSTTSCGSKPGNTEQVKSFVLMENIDDDYKYSLMEDFNNLIAQNKVKKVVLSPDKVNLIYGNDAGDCNPWLEYCRKMFIEKNFMFLWEVGWDLDRDKTEQNIRTRWQSICTGGYDAEDINTLKNRIEDDHKERAEYAADFNDRMVCVMNEDINRCTLALFALQNYTEMEATGLLIANAYVDYIYKTAKEKVKIYDCEYSKDDSTKSVDSYYIIYTIDEDFYILVRYSEEKKSTRFMIETLSRGKELIEIERKLKNYL